MLCKREDRTKAVFLLMNFTICVKIRHCQVKLQPVPLVYVLTLLKCHEEIT